MVNVAKTCSIPVFLVYWTDINPEQYCTHISCEENESGGWSSKPMVITAPEGWHVGVSNGGTLEMYDDENSHVAFTKISDHRKSVETANGKRVRWLPIREAEDGECPCCPTCGQTI
jgi:hypothetical protein